MIRIFIFSYSGDAAEAVACVRCARMAVPCASVTVVDDASSPVQEETAEALRSMGAEYVQSSWERHGNLRGPDCIRGMLSEMCREAEDDDILVKVDCDTALLAALDGAAPLVPDVHLRRFCQWRLESLRVFVRIERLDSQTSLPGDGLDAPG